MREGFYRGYRFPIEIIRHCVWLYYRFSLLVRHRSSTVRMADGIVVLECGTMFKMQAESYATSPAE